MSVNIDRIVLIVLDGVGAGELPDASLYGDEGSSTLENLAQAVGGLSLPNLQRLGLGNLLEIVGTPPVSDPIGCYGRMAERSPGKDSVTGHWEMMGIVLEQPFPTYPNGFPLDVMTRFEVAIGTPTLGNYPSSGTEILNALGAEHIATGYPIVYTSADSVFQIAAHEDTVSVDRLYEMCETARNQLVGGHAVGRVIARPFVGLPGSFKRTERRRDFPLTPPPNLLDALLESGRTVHAIGKIFEFFNGRGISSWDHTTNNADHIAALARAICSCDASLIFANLEDFDMLYGHRNDVKGFAAALVEFDNALGDMLGHLRSSDLLLIVNDHGNDPTTPSTDHSREYSMLLAHSPAVQSPCPLGDRSSFSDIAATIREIMGLPQDRYGASFLPQIR